MTKISPAANAATAAPTPTGPAGNPASPRRTKPAQRKEQGRIVTKTDLQAVSELQEQYKPRNQGVLSANESDLIYRILELDARTDIELENIRNMSVMFYSQVTDRLIQNGKQAKAMVNMDAMSGVCGVINREKISRKMSV